MQAFSRDLAALAPGQILLAPGGWRWPENNRPIKHDILFIIERMEEEEKLSPASTPTYRLTVVNPGMGNEYHPVKPSFYPPKMLYKSCIVLKVCFWSFGKASVEARQHWRTIFTLYIFSSALFFGMLHQPPKCLCIFCV